MTDVKRLLEQAIPLPWRVLKDDDYEGTGILGGGDEWSIDEGQLAYAQRQVDYFPDEANAALIVFAVNRLPGSEAVVEAAGALVTWIDGNGRPKMYPEASGLARLRAALARLRDESPA